MISTPYFDDLQKLSVRTAKTRSQNNYLSVDLTRFNFSKSEINEITELGNFLVSRECEKKKCTKCKRNKILAWFGKDKRRKDGLDVYCKGCKSKCQAKYYYKDHEKTKKRKRESQPRYDLNKLLIERGV